MVAHLEQNGINHENLQYHHGRRLTIDPNSETFVGDNQANALRTREYRKGFVVADKV